MTYSRLVLVANRMVTGVLNTYLFRRSDGKGRLVSKGRHRRLILIALDRAPKSLYDAHIVSEKM